MVAEGCWTGGAVCGVGVTFLSVEDAVGVIVGRILGVGIMEVTAPSQSLVIVETT